MKKKRGGYRTQIFGGYVVVGNFNLKFLFNGQNICRQTDVKPKHKGFLGINLCISGSEMNCLPLSTLQRRFSFRELRRNWAQNATAFLKALKRHFLKSHWLSQPFIVIYRISTNQQIFREKSGTRVSEGDTNAYSGMSSGVYFHWETGAAAPDHSL